MSENQANVLEDSELVERILAGEKQLYEVIIRRYNQRLYRVARSIVRNEEEAEDVIQETYVRAFEHLAQFEGRALFSTWLTKIAVHEAWGRMKQRDKHVDIDFSVHEPKRNQTMLTPEEQQFAEETRALLERAVDELPDSYRSVFVMRSIEEMSTSETAECLDITEETVKVRLLRARRMLRQSLFEKVHAANMEAFTFLGARCDRLTSAVLHRINGQARAGTLEREAGTKG